ncbi:hypothetical protein Tco_1002197 [Tanacetum coccineum]|uniref:Uncharacterized protein n=1 Tax=Tanacetum coccineum TaxID=301880 RepID=A0ABQ5F667_9ASTR
MHLAVLVQIKKVDRGITMINHTQTEAMGILTNVLFQVGVTTIIAKFLILDIPIDRDALIVVGRGFIYTIGGIVNTPERFFSAFDGICHQTFYAVRSDVLWTAKSDRDDEEEYEIKRNKFGAPFMTMRGNDAEAGSSRSKCSRQYVDRGRSIASITSNIKELLNSKLLHEFYSTYKFDEVCADDELQTKKIIKFRHGGRAYNLTLLEFARRLGLHHADELEEDGFDVVKESCFYYQKPNFEGDSQDDHLWLVSKDYWIARKSRVLTDVVLRSLSAPICCRDLDITTLRWLIDSEGRLIPEDPQPGVPRVGIPRPPRALMQDLYAGVFAHMVGVYSVDLQGAYNPLGYAQP